MAEILTVPGLDALAMRTAQFFGIDSSKKYSMTCFGHQLDEIDRVLVMERH